MYEYAKAKGYLVLDSSSGAPLITKEEVGQGTATVDLTNSASRMVAGIQTATACTWHPL
jgi:hypothetical protein